uniref:Uncharacterized protein n=1 Tax=Knipowitschia caucasica TaxID=637954 RepID=A0AAV2J156_KNICA
MRAKLDILALVLGALGIVGTIAVTAIPLWRVWAFIGELQASRGLMCSSIILAVIGFVITISGTKVTSCCNDSPGAKTTMLAIGGCFFLLACLTTLIPVCWVAHTVIRDFNNPLMMVVQRRELGAALYVGWATSGILLAAGIIFLLRFSQRRSQEERSGYTEAHALTCTEESVYLHRAPSSTHKTVEYV